MMNIPTPQVSVVIPAYNQAKYLDVAIRSALAQNFENYEIIVVDDGSTDHTEAVVTHFGSAVRYIYQANEGLAGARNTGIRAAKGEFIALLDSDDAWEPNYLAEMMALAEANRDVAVVYCGVQYMDAEGAPLPQAGRSKPIPVGEVYDVMLRYNPLIPSAVVLNRTVVLAAGLFDVRFRRLQDWELWIRLLRQDHTFVGYAGALVHYRIHGTSLSTDGIGGQDAARLLVEKHFGRDDREWTTWPADKRRAYGGFYRYCAVQVALLRQGDWQLCARYLRQAFRADPTLAVDLDLFYELAFGTQAAGHRGDVSSLLLAEQQRNVAQLLAWIFAPPRDATLATLTTEAYGTAYYALALLAYQMMQPELARRWLLQAIRRRPGLGRCSRVFKLLVMSLLGRAGIEWVRQMRGAARYFANDHAAAH